jgi:hypothetical protein
VANATYVARRGLITGHTADTEYMFDFETQSINRPNGDDLKVRSESMNGTVETLFFGERRIWTVRTIPVSASSDTALELYEFLRSTADGQNFVLDVYGTEADPVNPITVVREDDGYTEEMFMAVDGTGDYVSFTFQVREV